MRSRRLGRRYALTSNEASLRIVTDTADCSGVEGLMTARFLDVALGTAGVLFARASAAEAAPPSPMPRGTACVIPAATRVLWTSAQTPRVRQAAQSVPREVGRQMKPVGAPRLWIRMSTATERATRCCS